MGQGMWVASRNWQWLGNTFSPRRARKKHSPVDTLILVWWDSCCTFDLQNVSGHEFVFFLSLKVCGFCYRSNRRLKTAGLSRFFTGKEMSFSSLHIALGMPKVCSVESRAFQSPVHASFSRYEEHFLWSLLFYNSLPFKVLFLSVRGWNRWAQVSFSLKILKLFASDKTNILLPNTVSSLTRMRKIWRSPCNNDWWT